MTQVAPNGFEYSVETDRKFRKKRGQQQIWLALLGLTTLIFFVAFLTVLILIITETKNNDIKLWTPSDSPLGSYSKAAVAAEQGRCSEVGRGILHRGGNAVDAAIAVQICTNVEAPYSAGLGGGHFMAIYNSSTRTCWMIDARERAPSAATQEMYVNRTTDSLLGWLAPGVPGTLHGLWQAHRQFGSGRFSWQQLLQPSIDLLASGVRVSHAFAEAIQLAGDHIAPGTTMNVYINPKTNQLYKEGELFYDQTLQSFLSQLSTARPDPVAFFYNSGLTDAMVQEIQSGGGIISRFDMQSYRSIVRRQSDTIYVDINANNGQRLRACALPPPSSGGITLGLINIMAGFAPKNSKLDTFKDNVDFYQNWLEASKFIYGQRSRLGDIDFVQEALQIVRNVTSADYANWVRSRIQSTAQPFEYYNSNFEVLPEDQGTSHASIVDEDGNAVSITSTINTRFGSKRRSTATGLMWNNEMDDFSTPGSVNYFGLRPSRQNFIAPGKRPMSSMSPVIVFEKDTGQVRLVLGGSGGSRIISGVANVAVRTLFLNQTIKQAIDAPRLHNQLLPNYTWYMPGFPQQYVNALNDRGQIMIPWPEHTTSIVNGISRMKNWLFANSDYRRGASSYPAGF